MKHKRNVEGLRQNAQRKKLKVLHRAEEGIKQLIKENRPVNFKTVAEVSNVSVAWLYREPEIKSRIEHLRESRTQKKKPVPSQQKASEVLKDAEYQVLKRRLQKVEKENRELRDCLEAIHGQHRDLAEEKDALIQENELLRRENEALNLKLLISKLINEVQALKHCCAALKKENTLIKEEIARVQAKFTQVKQRDLATRSQPNPLPEPLKQLLEQLGLSEKQK